MVKEQVSGLYVEQVDRCGLLVLNRRPVEQVNTGLHPGDHRESRAVDALAAGTAPDIRHAQVGLRRRDRLEALGVGTSRHQGRAESRLVRAGAGPERPLIAETCAESGTNDGRGVRGRLLFGAPCSSRGFFRRRPLSCSFQPRRTSQCRGPGRRPPLRGEDCCSSGGGYLLFALYGEHDELALYLAQGRLDVRRSCLSAARALSAES